MGLRRWWAPVVVAVAVLAACTSGSDPDGRRATQPSVTAPAASEAPGTATVPPSTEAPTASVPAAPPSTDGQLPLSSSDEQRCAIAAEAGVPLQGCSG